MVTEIINIEGIVIELQRKNVRNINLRIGRDRKVTISANRRVKLDKIEEFVKSKKDWINSSIIKMNNYQTKIFKDIEYVTGDLLKIQGNEYKIILALDKKNIALMQDNFIFIFTTDITNKIKKKAIVDKMIKKIAVDVFENSLDKMLKLIEPYGVSRPEMKIRKMTSRWGSCNKSRNKITINYELVKLSKNCLEYVILHELVHFLVSAHNKSFYNYMSIIMPDWKTRKKLMNGD